MSHHAREVLQMAGFAVVALVALGLLTWGAHLFLPAPIMQWVLAPFYVGWLVFVVGCWGIGPFGKRLREAALADAQRENTSQ
jgi:hypothetical protein